LEEGPNGGRKGWVGGGEQKNQKLLLLKIPGKEKQYRAHPGTSKVWGEG